MKSMRNYWLQYGTEFPPNRHLDDHDWNCAISRRYRDAYEGGANSELAPLKLYLIVVREWDHTKYNKDAGIGYDAEVYMDSKYGSIRHIIPLYSLTFEQLIEFCDTLFFAIGIPDQHNNDEDLLSVWRDYHE